MTDLLFHKYAKAPSARNGPRQLTDEESRSRYRFDRESIKCLWQTRRNHALSPIFRVIFFQKQTVEKLVKPVFSTNLGLGNRVIISLSGTTF